MLLNLLGYLAFGFSSPPPPLPPPRPGPRSPKKSREALKRILAQGGGDRRCAHAGPTDREGCLRRGPGGGDGSLMSVLALLRLLVAPCALAGALSSALSSVFLYIQMCNLFIATFHFFLYQVNLYFGNDMILLSEFYSLFSESPFSFNSLSLYTAI